MKQLSSDFTPLLKFILPWAIILGIVVGTIAAFVQEKYFTGIATIIIATPVVGFMKTMLMSLKKVFLDKENKVLIVKGPRDVSIPYAHVKEILRPSMPPYIATVLLTSNYSFGNEFTFLPSGHPLSWDNYDDELEKKIKF